ncbi:unnamed protein product [Cyprideis torosa]|uniref:Uncharacterized protein n=1 Tax=Cyprideis torosa TaxID=163714 RepID=A0A7R8WGB5_9CRUS|nr:unnamed protein product [Cyprideis torosa]CAG0898007.1 unnamed protein product [Cyprideis torosa]
MSEEVTRIIAAPIPHPRQTWLDYVRELGYQGSVPEDVRDLQESYYDILLAEQNYQKELRILKNGFLDGLRDVLPGTVTKILEEDVENLLIASQKLTVSLEGVYEENFILHNGVSDILDEMIQQRAFRPFQQYCMDYLYVHDRIQRYKTRRDFQTKLSELEQIISETNQESLKLEGLLPRPTSQIMKYARLLGEVIKKQEKCGDVDASIITRHVETHKEIKKIAALCDEAKRDKEKEVKVADCYKSFDFSEVPSRELPPWTMPRYLLYHQELQPGARDEPTCEANRIAVRIRSLQWWTLSGWESPDGEKIRLNKFNTD